MSSDTREYISHTGGGCYHSLHYRLNLHTCLAHTSNTVSHKDGHLPTPCHWLWAWSCGWVGLTMPSLISDSRNSVLSFSPSSPCLGRQVPGDPVIGLSSCPGDNAEFKHELSSPFPIHSFSQILPNPRSLGYRRFL